LSDDRRQVSLYLAETIRELKPDLILTYDAAGIDGHPDHMACSEIVSQLTSREFPGIRVWCVALPGRLLTILKLSGQMIGDSDIDRRRASPTMRIFIGRAVLPKIRAWYAYRSQRGAIAKGLGRLAPIWLAVSVMQFEYFAEARP